MAVLNSVLCFLRTEMIKNFGKMDLRLEVTVSTH